MDNINYNPNNADDDDHIHPSESVGVFKSLRGEEKSLRKNETKFDPNSDQAPLYPRPPKILPQVITHIDNSSSFSRAKKWSGVCLACLAVLLVIIRWSQQENMIQINQKRYFTTNHNTIMVTLLFFLYRGQYFVLFYSLIRGQHHCDNIKLSKVEAVIA